MTNNNVHISFHVESTENRVLKASLNSSTQSTHP